MGNPVQTLNMARLFAPSKAMRGVTQRNKVGALLQRSSSALFPLGGGDALRLIVCVSWEDAALLQVRDR
jgi:hypothetical protein